MSGATDRLARSDGAPVVRATDVSKVFRLYRERPLSMRSAFTGFHRARYEEFWAVRNVSLEVPRGQMMGIIGHNGSGKSTFLRLLAGVYRPTTGEVSVNGRVSALLELGAGFHPELSGRENIYMNGAILGLERGEVDDLVEDIVAFSGIGDFVDNPVDVYSSGMRARLGFAVSVFLRPDVLLADEIIAVGDAAFAAQCMEHLQDMRDQGVTVVLVSHSLSLVERLCDTAAWLDHGEIRMVGDPSEIVLAYGDHMAERAAHQRSTATGDALDDGSGSRAPHSPHHRPGAQRRALRGHRRSDGGRGRLPVPHAGRGSPIRAASLPRGSAALAGNGQRLGDRGAGHRRRRPDHLSPPGPAAGAGPATGSTSRCGVSTASCTPAWRRPAPTSTCSSRPNRSRRSSSS